MIIRWIKWFRKDGSNEEPKGIFFAKADACNEAYLNHYSIESSFLYESFLRNNYSICNRDMYKGGVIVFGIDSGKTLRKYNLSTFKRFLKTKFHSIITYSFERRSLNKLIERWLEDFGQDYKKLSGGIALSKSFKGKWINRTTKEEFDERSLTLQLAGLSSELLLLLAIQFCRKFKLKCAIIRDFNTEEIFYVGEKDIPMSSSNKRTREINEIIQTVEKFDFELNEGSKVKFGFTFSYLIYKLKLFFG